VVSTSAVAALLNFIVAAMYVVQAVLISPWLAIAAAGWFLAGCIWVGTAWIDRRTERIIRR
jgi:hypothetical protein